MTYRELFVSVMRESTDRARADRWEAQLAASDNVDVLDKEVPAASLAAWLTILRSTIPVALVEIYAGTVRRE
ncbi:MAG: hypothetical protein M5U05_19580 [Anaerolineales bacterium]|nr:hypothetical protein [Anaerolineales bacterium]